MSACRYAAAFFEEKNVEPLLCQRVADRCPADAGAHHDDVPEFPHVEMIARHEHGIPKRSPAVRNLSKMGVQESTR
jgi:hypothetical protein